METWRHDWRDRRVDRLEERVYAIEEARRREKQRAFERVFYAMLAVIWIVVIASAVLEHSS
jgi:cell division protein FtsL